MTWTGATRTDPVSAQLDSAALNLFALFGMRKTLEWYRRCDQTSGASVNRLLFSFRDTLTCPRWAGLVCRGSDSATRVGVFVYRQGELWIFRWRYSSMG